MSDSTRDSKRPPLDQISRIINRVRHAQAGHNIQDQQPWCVFQLLPGDLEHLFSFLRDDEDEKLWSFFRDKVRYDYDSRTCRLSLRMPTPIHEIFLTSVTENIRDQLKKITTGTSRVAADFAKNVDSKGSIALKYEVDGTQNQGLSRVSRHEPDGTFKHREAQDPSIIIEISYSQKRKALIDLAEFYILGSDGNIQRVIGLDIEYKATKRATLSVWQPEYIGDEGSEELVATQALVAQEFRDQDGNPNDKNPGLVLLLQDFATEALIEDPSVLTQQITISSSELCSMLTSAEAEAKQGEENRGKRMAMKGSGRKRWRTRTPPEELDSDDERELLAEEERAAKRIARQ
ncbi:hypothetical protein DL95DRAFT_54131 [Leptodontidium sp. 2 PMI_412]|nr:hypothetical protein DL95DRAFT_54131 [Leptodontidium sp. 2 PMI_412]